MKKITLFLILLVSGFGFGQVCNQTFSVSGLDTGPTVLNIQKGDLDCFLGDVNTITLTAATLGANNLCGDVYSFSVNIDGVVSTKCAQDLIGLDLTNFQSMIITSSNLTGWSSNNITIAVTIAVDFTTDQVPYCDATLISPLNGSQNVSASGILTWTAATAASGYKLSVGTTNGGTELLNALDVGNNTTYNIPGLLNAATNYFVKILPYNQNGDALAASCSDYNFTTCQAQSQLSENFNSLSVGTLPTCWSTIVNSSDEWASINSYDNAIHFSNSGDLSANLLLITPNLPDLANSTHQLRFKAKANNQDATIIVGIMTEPTDASTFMPIETITPNTSFADHTIMFNAPMAGQYIAFKHGLGGIYNTITLDDLAWSEVPTEAPGCISTIQINQDGDCGNYMNTLSWQAVQNAEGYRITMGTSEGGNDVLDNYNLGNVLSYSFSGFANTAYYFTIKPYNVIGNATGCMENNFATVPTPCYCEAVPDQNYFEGNGITSLQLGTTSFMVQPVTYTDFTGFGEVLLQQGMNANLKIEFSTGYTYDTHVWIDFNDDYTFSENERVFSGESSASNPTIFDASFPMPPNDLLGQHRMRIASANYLQQIPNPCYNGAFAVNLDFLVNIVPAPTCFPPTATSVSEIASNDALINWTSEGELFNMEYSSNLNFSVGSGQGISVFSIEGNSHKLTELQAETTYKYYIQRDCGDASSPWYGPYFFKTACEGFTDFSENFNTAVNLPQCWYKIVNANTEYASVYVYEFGDNAYMYNAGDSNANLFLITPPLLDLPNGTHRIKFKARADFSGQTLLVGTISDSANSGTFTSYQTIALSTSMTEYIVVFNQPTNDSFVAFKHGLGANFRSIFIDDVVWETNPVAVPDCIESIFADIDDTCGNYPTIISWETVSGTDGYKLSIGTASGLNDVVNAQNLSNNVTSYTFSGNYNASYFYTITPYNSFGDALCTESFFTTSENGCYCLSVPTTLDGTGITNIVAGTAEFTGNGETYMDFTAEQAAQFQQETQANLQITFNTFSGFSSYAYDTNVWIDFNDDFIFSANELVFDGESMPTSPTTLNASFNLAANSQLGLHRMRIAAADTGQLIPNPCYSGSYGVTADLMVNILDDLSIEDIDNTSFSIYPNPVNDILYIKHEQEISAVEVFNVLGQLVITTDKSQIDMSDLSQGTYILKINFEGKLKTIKVIKN